MAEFGLFWPNLYKKNYETIFFSDRPNPDKNGQIEPNPAKNGKKRTNPAKTDKSGQNRQKRPNAAKNSQIRQKKAILSASRKMTKILIIYIIMLTYQKCKQSSSAPCFSIQLLRKQQLESARRVPLLQSQYSN